MHAMLFARLSRCVQLRESFCSPAVRVSQGCAGLYAETISCRIELLGGADKNKFIGLQVVG